MPDSCTVDKVEVKELYDIFKSISPDSAVDRETFKKGLSKLTTVGLKHIDDTPFADRLFDLLDTNRDGVVDLGEFVCGLSLLCKGSVEEKLERKSTFYLISLAQHSSTRLVSFKAYDIDGNGYISKDELSQMFKSAWMAGFKALCSTQGWLGFTLLCVHAVRQ